MKKQILLALSVVFVLGLVMAAFAYNQSSAGASNSCPLMSMNVQASATQHSGASCCDRDDCCCKNGSCPMKQQSENTSAHSCPMKEKNAQATGIDMKNVTVVSGEGCCSNGGNCCNGGACCKDKHS